MKIFNIKSCVRVFGQGVYKLRQRTAEKIKQESLKHL